MIVASSWDDGAKDKFVVEIYRRLGLPTTFFPIGDGYRPKTYEDFEVGNHTFSHAQLSRLTPEEVAEQISKANEVLGRPVCGFAYPYGVGDMREVNTRLLLWQILR